MYGAAFTLLKVTNKHLQIAIPCESSVMLLKLPSCVHTVWWKCVLIWVCFCAFAVPWGSALTRSTVLLYRYLGSAGDSKSTQWVYLLLMFCNKTWLHRADWASPVWCTAFVHCWSLRFSPIMIISFSNVKSSTWCDQAMKKQWACFLKKRKLKQQSGDYIRIIMHLLITWRCTVCVWT